MSTDADNKQAREANENWNDGLEFTQGIPIQNNYDPSGAYPKVEYTFGFSINHSALGADVDELWTGAGARDVDLDIPAIRPSIYPNNQVNSTPYGHVISVDDTPGGERILIKHGAGHGIELKSDGSILITSRKNVVEVIDNNQTVIVKGEANLVYEGNLKMSVTGDMDLNVLGDYNVSVKGQHNIDIEGSEIKRVAKSVSAEVLGDCSKTVLGNDTNAVMGTRTDIVAKKFEHISSDDIIFNTNKDIMVSAEGDIAFASESFAAVAQNMSVIGDKGTIGGENCEHFGKTYSGPADGSGTGTTFYGSLVGLAHEASTSRYSLFAKEAWICSGVAKYALTANNVSMVPPHLLAPPCFPGEINFCPTYKMIMEWNQNEPDWHMPTHALITSIHNEMDKGVKNVKVWDEEITNRTAYTDQYEGVFRITPTLQDIRTAMRDEAFRAGKIPHILVAQGLLHPDWASNLPDNIKRASDANATSIFGINKIGNSTETQSDRFKVRK